MMNRDSEGIPRRMSTRSKDPAHRGGEVSKRTENRYFYPYGAATHCRYRQNIPSGLPRGGFNLYFTSMQCLDRFSSN